MMLSFTDFLITEEEQRKPGLHVFDIDGTLLNPTAKVLVKNKKTGGTTELSHSEFNSHKLAPHEEYDFSQFKSSDKFHESKPIHRMVSKLNKIHDNAKKVGSKVIMNTARGDFDNKDKFLDKFRKHGVDIDNIHVHRTGNDTSNKPVGEKKNDVIRNHLNKGDYRHVTMYDDDKNNLKSFLGLKKEYPHVQFNAHHVHPDGSIKRYKEE